MNEDNLDDVKLTDCIVDSYLLCKWTKGVPGKTTLVKLHHLKNLRVPVNLDIKPVRLRSRILKINKISCEATSNLATIRSPSRRDTIIRRICSRIENLVLI